MSRTQRHRSNSILRLTYLLFILFAGILHAKEDATYNEVLAQPALPFSVKVSYGDFPDQFYLVWQQPEPAPLVVFIHGGCWLEAFDIQHAKPLMSALFNAGFTVVGLEYQRTTENRTGWPYAINDVVEGLGHALKNTLYDTQSDIAVLGHSAGGHLALLAGTRSSQWVDNQRVRIHGLAAIVDITRYALGDNSCQKATAKFMGGLPSQVSEAYQLASPLNFSLPQNISVTLWHGAADTIVPVSQATYPMAQIELAPNAGHFAWIHAQTDAYKRLLNALQEPTQ